MKNIKIKNIVILLSPLIILAVIYLLFILLMLISGYMIGPGPADYVYKVADVCELHRNNSVDIYIVCDDIEGSVDVSVTSLGWNKDFLVATTHPVVRDIDTDPRGSGYSNSYIKESITYWWVMDLQNKKLYGPLNSEQDFNQQKNKLNIGDIQLWTLDEAKDRGTKID